MGFFNEYPYTDFHELNIDWIIAKIKDYETSLETLKEEILAETKAYTLEVLQPYQDQLNALYDSFTDFTELINKNFDDFEDNIIERLNAMDKNISDLKDYIDNKVVYLENRTQIMIEQSEEYIIDNIATFLGNVLVLNYFTGEYVTIQDMFNYLAQLHATDAINYTTLAARSLSYNDVISKNATYTQIAFNGDNILV